MSENSNDDNAAILAAIAQIDQRLAALEGQMRDLGSQVGRVHHFAEMVLNEVHARRRDRQADDNGGRRWSEAGFPLIERNWPIRFGIGGDGADYLAGNWWEPEYWGLWGREDTHAIRFALESYRGGYVEVNLTLIGLVGASAQRPTVEFTANGYFLLAHTLRPDEHTLKLRLPPACIGEGDVALYMKINPAISPQALGINEDDRVLGVGLISLDIC
ncbi:hypothetical protein ACFOKF_04490 [Sphingobium rhizovicinum]|uniref:Uncharacterized protein n=1 Tax=Sphingobium rhizovicinum TaxID=432308 RepID=A0ABV7NAE5_9SPHN